MALPSSYNLTNGALNFNLDNYLAYFILNDRAINFSLNAVTLPSGEFRLLEDGEYLLLEDVTNRLLE